MASTNDPDAASNAAVSDVPKQEDTKKQQNTVKMQSSFVPQDDWTLLSQGAEARIWKIPNFRNHSSVVIAKERFSKSYRHPKLDERLTTQRCRAEARILAKCAKRALFRVPAVVLVEAPVLYLEYLPFPTLRQHLDDLIEKNATGEVSSDCGSYEAETMELAAQMGSLVSKLHYALGIVHGDLTTSNFMTTTKTDPTTNGSNSKLALIDFGLAKNTESAEERAVDLYVLERALTSTHPSLPEQFWPHLLSSYAETAAAVVVMQQEGNKSNNKIPPQQATLTRLEQVRQRGRKRECFG